jgi:hypothetical protein
MALDVPDAGSGIWTMIAGGLGTAIGVTGTLLVALVNRRSAIETMINTRLAALLDRQAKEIEDLRARIEQLESELELEREKRKCDSGAKNG